MKFNDIEIKDYNSPIVKRRADEYNRLVNSINLYQNEEYDCSSSNVWSFQKSTDVRDGINIRFGNMCGGFPFKINGVMFNHSEGSYIAGGYALNNPDCIRIQKELAINDNGLFAKKNYRNNPDYTQHFRDDFHSFNVEWMKYVVWQKSIQNERFTNLLRKLPLDAHLVENSTMIHGDTREFWGALNSMIVKARKEAEKKVKYYKDNNLKGAPFNSKTAARNSINNIGHFTGKNVMGKIIKLCSLALIYGQEPTIDIDLLRSKELYLLGEQVKI